MIKNYFKIAFRNLIRHKAFSLINIAGLAIGMACSILILMWVRDELSYDRFHKNADHIYRIVVEASGFKAAVNPAGMPEGLKSEMPQIKDYVRLSHIETHLFQVGEQKFEEKRVFFVDSNFLNFFSFPLAEGDPNTVLNRSDGIVITEDMAKKYYGKQDAIGKVFRRDNQENCVVTGVLKNLPGNSHLQFDFLIPMSAIAKTNEDLVRKTWDNFNFYTYVLLDKNTDEHPVAMAKAEKQMQAIYNEHEKQLKTAFQFQPLTRIHLHANQQIDLPGNGNIQYVNIFFVVAIFILVVACINFMNLATARSARRAKEVGLRKVVGAERYQIISQFLGESMLISVIGFLISIGLVLLLLPLFNEIAGKKLSVRFFDVNFLLMLLGIALGTGLLSGIYPALFLSGFQPVKVLKGKMKSIGGNLMFRNALVVTQFIVSIMLLVGTAVVYNQLNYIKKKSLGFDKENLLYLAMTGDMWKHQDALKLALKNDPYTSNFAITGDLPTNLISGTANVKWPGMDPKTQIIFPTMNVNEDFFDVFNMQILKGRAFSREFKADSTNYILNEKAVAVMGLKMETVVGKQMSLWDNKGTIVGVVKDFNYKPIQTPIEPMIILLNRWGGYVVIRTKPGATEASIKALGKISQELNPSYPFSYGFLDQDLANNYRSEERMGKLFNLFAVLAIFISCLGLYGLSAFMAEQRTKEIGVRKVLGASTFNIVYLLSHNFTKLILIAVVVAVPLSWYAVNTWLDSFAYRIHVNWLIFLTASLSALFIAWLTVSYESIKAAISNPATSLRSE